MRLDVNSARAKDYYLKKVEYNFLINNTTTNVFLENSAYNTYNLTYNSIYNLGYNTETVGWVNTSEYSQMTYTNPVMVYL